MGSGMCSSARFIGGAIAPYLAGKLAEWFNPHVPFLVGGVFVVLSVIYLWLNRKHLAHIDQAAVH